MSPGPIVLNVEDNPSARFLRTRILERAGFTVDEAGTAARAAERAVQLSDPMPPLPAGFSGGSLGVHFGFGYTAP